MEKDVYTDFKWHIRAGKSIANGYLTNSKRPECLVKGIYPTHVVKGDGCFLWDHTGRKYIDYICGLGTNLIGYSNEEISTEINLQSRQGVTPSLASTIEVIAAEKLKEHFPFVELVRFLKTGSEACLASIRIARSATGRKKVLSEGYHGWGDEFTSLKPPAIGVPHSDNIDHLKSLDQIDSNIAAVIVEPIITDWSENRVNWLKELREKCTKHKVVLIFDEIITGFRFKKHSVSSLCNITPDLICLGKAMSNGMPLAAVGGRYEVMDSGEWFVSSTYAGETLSLASANKTMELLQIKFKIDDLWISGQKFLDEFNKLMPGKLWIEGYPTRGVFKGDELVKALFWQEACRSGIIFGPSWFFNFKHPEMSEVVLNICSDVARRINTGSVKLLGELPTSPFSQQMREGK